MTFRNEVAASYELNSAFLLLVHYSKSHLPLPIFIVFSFNFGWKALSPWAVVRKEEKLSKR